MKTTRRGKRRAGGEPPPPPPPPPHVRVGTGPCVCVCLFVCLSVCVIFDYPLWGWVHGEGRVGQHYNGPANTQTLLHVRPRPLLLPPPWHWP
jgi:hypothetical protein